jgi:5'-3' exonuclease
MSNHTGLIDGDVLLHMCLWKAKTFSDFKVNFHMVMEDIKDSTWISDYIIATGSRSGTSFRDIMYPDYKRSKTREKGRTKRVEFFSEAKEHIMSLACCEHDEQLEADDLIGHWSSQVVNPIIITIDKDLDQISGLHYNPHPTRKRLYRIGEKESKEFFLKQLLTGDGMDNIPGVQGVGPEKTKKIIEQSTNLAASIIETYKKVYKDDWVDYFLANGKLLYIQRKPKDYFTLKLFKEQFLND